MAEQVADRDMFRNVRIGDRKIGQMLFDGIIPPELAFVHEHSNARGRERLGAGGNRKNGVLTDASIAADFANAVAACNDQIAVFYNRDGEAWHLPSGHCFLDVSVDSGQRIGTARRSRHQQEQTGHSDSCARRHETVSLSRVAYAFTRILTDSIAAWPDLRKGRGIGWAIPFSSTVRERSVYSPAGRPGSNTAQWTFPRRIGQVRGRPAVSKPSVPAGMASFGSSPPHLVGGPRISASSHGALAKFLSSAGHS